MCKSMHGTLINAISCYNTACCIHVSTDNIIWEMFKIEPKSWPLSHSYYALNVGLGLYCCVSCVEIEDCVRTFWVELRTNLTHKN